MKWMLMAITAIILFVIVFFGLSLISNEQSKMPSEVLNLSEYQQQAETSSLLSSILNMVPYVVMVFAAILTIYFLARKAKVI
jgi:H+/gluconate symporter-like permease